ncbi:MAG: metallophosphoesterase [Chitinophagales bacterium]
MRRFLQFVFRRPIAWLAEKLSSAPHEHDVFASLRRLLRNIEKETRKGIVLPFDYLTGRFIIFSDQHKGTRNSVDDFMGAESSYLAALNYYQDQQFHFINLGDCEELWKNRPDAVIKKNQSCLLAEKKFQDLGRYYRIFGNHDLAWKFALQRNVYLRPVFGKNLKVYEGMVLKTSFRDEGFSIFLAHGHQGDRRNDGNAFSIWFVANIWTAIQRYLRVNINTPATSFELTDRHNLIMYKWSVTQRNLIFISGHTHKPVFASLDHMESLNQQLVAAKLSNERPAILQIEQEIERRKSEYRGKKQMQASARPTYFNSGCCCFDDGDITGIEIADGHIRLIKWQGKDGVPVRVVLEEARLEEVFEKISRK